MRNFEISPKVGMCVFGAMTVIGAAGTVIFPDYVPPGAAKAIVQTCLFCTTVVSGLALGSHAYSSSTPGPLAPPDSPATAAMTVADKASRS